MKIELEKQEHNVVKMNIEFPAKDATEAYNKASMRISQHINIPGFRKGKAPKVILEKNIGKQRGMELIQMMADSQRVNFKALLDYIVATDLTWDRTLDICLDILTSQPSIQVQSPEDIRRLINEYGLETVASIYEIPVDVLAKYNLHTSQGCECGCQDVPNENIY